MRLFRTWIAVVAWCLAAAAGAAETKDLGPLLEKLRAVGPKGAGHRAASAAWAELVKADARQLPQILAGLDGANPLAANWIRAAADAVAERDLARGQKLPAAELEAYLADTRHNPRGRRLAYEWIVRVEPGAADRLAPRMLDDPSVELRRDAVGRLLDEAVRLSGNKDDAVAKKATGVYERALLAARDDDQIKLASEALKKAGRTVDLPRHFGFLMQWKLLGPFDNKDKKGFAVAYAPEEKLDLAATTQGSQGPVKWTDHTTTDDYGNVDLNKAVGVLKGELVYAAADFQSAEARPAEIRIGTANAYKVWLNGKLVGQANVYHSNVKLDQYVSPCELKQGHNVVLVKVCQNEQTEDWAADWKFQLRICDATGTAILSTDRPPTTAAATSSASN